jgi:hypothetical protein
MIAKRRNSLAFIILAIMVFFLLAAWEASNWKIVTVNMPAEQRGESPLDITKRCVCFFRWDRKLHEWVLKKCYCKGVKPESSPTPTEINEASETPTRTSRPSHTPMPTWTLPPEPSVTATIGPYPSPETPNPYPTLDAPTPSVYP